MSLDRQRQAAKRLLRDYRAGDPDARARVRPYFAEADKVLLSSTQLVVARESGFTSWPALVRATKATDADLVRAARRGDHVALSDLLRFVKPDRNLLPAVVGRPNDADSEDFARCVGLLIDAGCDRDAKVKQGEATIKVIHLVRDNGHEAVERLLRERRADLQGLSILRPPSEGPSDGLEVAVGFVEKRTKRGQPWLGTVVNPTYPEDSEAYAPTLSVAQAMAESLAQACDWERPYEWIGPFPGGSYQLMASGQRRVRRGRSRKAASPTAAAAAAGAD